MNIKISVEYIGTNYSGWQKQENASTIQEKIENSIFLITGKPTEVFGSGRTDAGVHALGQVANFEMTSSIPAERVKYALNQHLPKDIRVLSSEEVPEEFHSRFSARHKTYLYKVQTGDVKRCFEDGRAYFVKGSLDIGKMQAAAKEFLGEHDFSAFKSEGSSAKNFVREIYKLDINQVGDIIEIEICGNGFLYNMVRIIAGTLIEIGKGKTFNISEILISKDRGKAGPTVPAQGLFLKEVAYDN